MSQTWPVGPNGRVDERMSGRADEHKATLNVLVDDLINSAAKHSHVNSWVSITDNKCESVKGRELVYMY